MAGVVIDEAHAFVCQAKMARHVAASRGVGERRLAGRRIEQAELRAELPRPPRQPAARHLETDRVVPAHVGLVPHDAVHPLVRRNARPREHDTVDVTRCQGEVVQERVDGAPRVARVVLQPGKALLGSTADDRPVLENGGSRAVRPPAPQAIRYRSVSL